MKKITRTKKIKYIFFKEKKKIVKLNYKKFLKDNQIHDFIKLTPQEFRESKKKNFFFHFNLQHSIHEKNKKYFLIKIIKHGYSDKKKYIHPILCPKIFILTKCISSKNYVDYSKITSKELSNSLITNKTLHNLKKLILSKYRNVLTQIDNDIKIKMGVSITKLKKLA